MGACCSQREKESLSTADPRFDITEVSKSLTYITRYFEENRESSIIVLCFSKDQLKNYLLSLSQIITIIKTKTGQIFVPTVLQNHPLNPTTEMLIYMRSIEKLDKYEIDREAILDETRLAKSFTIRQLQFITSDAIERKNQLINDLKNMYKNEGLMIIGGIQDPNKQNNLQMLFYKTENFRPGSLGPNSKYQISLDVKPHQASEKDFEICINQAQLDLNSQLRSVITFEDTYSRHHFLIYQEFEGDRLYMISKFPETINKEMQNDQTNGPKSSQISSIPSRQVLAEKLSKHLNGQEKRMEGQAVETIVNSSFADSFIIFSQ